MSATAASRLPARARAVIAAVVVVGLAASAALWRLDGPRGIGSVRVAAFLTVLIMLTWVLPLMLYQGTNAICVHFDEACFVVLAMLVPPLGVLVWFTVALVLAHVFRRRPLVKCLFNFGHVTSTVAVGLLTVHAVGGSARPDTPLGLAALALGAMAFLALNIFWLAALLAGLGQQSFRAALLDGSDLLLVVAVAGVVTGLVTGLAAASAQWIIPGVFLPFLVLRQVLAGHFRARQDRIRLKGLFDATLQMHGEMGGAAVEDAIRAAATELLRGDEAVITDTPPGPGQLVAKLHGGGRSRWLRVDGRKPLEPTEDADRAMLETLAAVGAGALANAALYEEVAEQRERLAAITASLGEGVCALDREGRITFLNPAGRTMLGVPIADDVDAPIKAPASMEIAALRCARSGSTVRNDDAVFERADGSPLAVGFTCSPVMTGGDVVGAVIAFSDITERKAFEERLAHHAFHDTLTGLANRRLFLDHLDHAMLRSQRQSEIHAVLFFDVDRFKLVNDNLGHQDGDELLKVVAARLAQVTRAGDTVARFGGDEFILLVENVSGIDEAVNVAERVQAQFAEPVVLAGHQEIFVTGSIGVALATGQRSRDDVLHDADVAMYRAKGRGPGEIEVFDQGAMAARSAERLDIEAALRRGIEHGEIEVHYQPIWDANTTVITGAEALVRWNHPTRGFLGPAAFVPIAEESGLILPLGRLVLETACRQAREWHRVDSTLDITVNLSARQFQHAGLTADIARILGETGMEPARLCLEITETLAMADTGRTISILETLKRLGVRLAIDDFGTGYSSLSYLKEFPVDVVKIDRSFVAGIGQSDVDEAIVAAVVALSRAVRMSTVAEGVETAEQLAHLVGLGCNRVQGFYLAKPMPAESFTGLLAQQLVLQDA